MKRSLIAVLFILVSLQTVSCSKIAFTNGEPVTEIRNIGGRFTAISMYNNVNVKLVHSDRPHLELTCPKNLIDNIVTELSVTGDTLIIRNDNTMNWIRSFDYSIDLTVYFDRLHEINYASIGELVCTDSLRGINETFIDSTDNSIDTLLVRGFKLNINEGSGSIDLTIGSERFVNRFNNGTSDVTLRGKASYVEHLTRTYGVIHAEEMEANIIRVQSESTNDVYVWARSSLTVWLYSIGNVYYKGDPEITVEACTNDGRVIKIE